jgi:molybdenum cofactor cytidylyltransferase
VLLALGDKVGVTPELVGRILAAAAAAPLVVPTVGDRASHPVLFRRELLPELLALRGDSGARAVVRRHLARAARVPGVPLHDVDDDSDYRALLEGRPPRAGDGLPLG